MAERPKTAATPRCGPARPCLRALRTPPPCPRLVPLATHARTRVPPRATVATAARHLPGALSGASSDDARRAGDGTACVDVDADDQYGPWEAWAGARCRAHGMPRAAQRANPQTGACKRAPHGISAGSTHLASAALGRPERSTMAAAGAAAAAVVCAMATPLLAAMTAPSEVPERRPEGDIRARLAGLEGWFGVVRASGSAPLASEEAAGRRKKLQTGSPHDGGPACDPQSISMCKDREPASFSAAARHARRAC